MSTPIAFKPLGHLVTSFTPKAILPPNKTPLNSTDNMSAHPETKVVIEVIPAKPENREVAAARFRHSREHSSNSQDQSQTKLDEAEARRNERFNAIRNKLHERDVKRAERARAAMESRAEHGDDSRDPTIKKKPKKRNIFAFSL